MVSHFYIKSPPKRNIPKYRVSRSHHYVMIFPKDLSIYGSGYILKGMPYTTFWDSFLEDCVKRMSKSAYSHKFYDEGQFEVMTACLN